MKPSWLLWGLGIGGGLSLLRWLRSVPLPAPVLSYLTPAQRDALYGPLSWVPAPSPNNPEGIRITNGFERKVVSVNAPVLGIVRVHEGAAPSLVRALSDIERLGWTDKIRSFEGGFEPRRVRGSASSSNNLSSHAYGTSIDVNAGSNPQGGSPTADQRDLASIFERHGWYWGARFSNPDPMHFEYVLRPESAASGAVTAVA